MLTNIPYLSKYPSDYHRYEKLIYFYKIERDGYYLLKIGIGRIIDGFTTERCIWDRIKKNLKIHRNPNRTKSTIIPLGALFGNRDLEKSIHKLFKKYKYENMKNYDTGNILHEYYHNTRYTMEKLVRILRSQTELLNINDNYRYFSWHLRDKLLNQSHL